MILIGFGVISVSEATVFCAGSEALYILKVIMALLN